jgi:hypothetical protein
MRLEIADVVGFYARVIFVNLMSFLQILGSLVQEMQKGIVVIYVPTAYNSASRPFEAAL